MKLIFEEANELEAEVQEELNEATGVKNKKYIISGLFTTTEEKNRNGRIYPKSLFESEVKKYNKEIKNNTIQTLMEMEHPARSTIDIMEAVAKVQELKMEGNKVYGKAVLLDNPKANQLKTLIDNGIKIGVSSRGLGRVQEGIVKEYKLLNYDCVANPSNYGSELNGIIEGFAVNEGILEDKTFEILESGDIQEVKVCKDNICSKYTKDEVQDALVSKVSELFKKL